MCYYKLDYYDVSLEILASYLQAFPESAIATNLKACNHFKLYNGKTADAELKGLLDKGINIQTNDLIRHNQVMYTIQAYNYNYCTVNAVLLCFNLYEFTVASKVTLLI